MDSVMCVPFVYPIRGYLQGEGDLWKMWTNAEFAGESSMACDNVATDNSNYAVATQCH